MVERGCRHLGLKGNEIIINLWFIKKEFHFFPQPTQICSCSNMHRELHKKITYFPRNMLICLLHPLLSLIPSVCDAFPPNYATEKKAFSLSLIIHFSPCICCKQLCSFFYQTSNSFFPKCPGKNNKHTCFNNQTAVHSLTHPPVK